MWRGVIGRGREPHAKQGRAPTLGRRFSLFHQPPTLPTSSRQMLCVGGSSAPLGWSFLSIARAPMAWAKGDVWTADVLLPAGARVEYKYVILEEQDWTTHTSPDAEGVVEYTYRTEEDEDGGSAAPPAVVARRMAIVAWQPGANRVVAVPTEDELAALAPGARVERVPARPTARRRPPRGGGAVAGAPRFGTLPGGGEGPLLTGPASSSSSDDDGDAYADGEDELAGTEETLVDGGGAGAVLFRRDVWGSAPATPTRPF